jgi:murein DD-endopeptidase MepM/ murein hydrolase activator NlpD
MKMSIAKKLSRLILCVSLLLTMGFSGVASHPSHAATVDEKQAEARRLQEQLDGLKQQSDQIAQEYSERLTELESVRYLINDNKQKLEKAQNDYLQSKSVLAGRLKAMYIAGDINSMEVLLESTSVDDMLNRYDFLNYIANQDLDIFKEMKELRREISIRQRDLEDQETRQQQAVAQMQQKQMELQASLAAQEKLLSGINAEILSLMSQTNNSGGGGGTVTLGTFLFPVRGSHTYSNDWHQPRTGHLHQGCDIFASMGTPCVACVSGTASTGEGKNAGNYIRLVGDDGNVYYYMHLQRFGQTGRVTQGTVIGYVGDTGNAQGTPPHNHFEIHPGGGAAINPYPILKQYDK